MAAMHDLAKYQREAYCSVLRAVSLSNHCAWSLEAYLSELRVQLCIDDNAHREARKRVASDPVVEALRSGRLPTQTQQSTHGLLSARRAMPPSRPPQRQHPGGVHSGAPAMLMAGGGAPAMHMASASMQPPLSRGPPASLADRIQLPGGMQHPHAFFPGTGMMPPQPTGHSRLPPPAATVGAQRQARATTLPFLDASAASGMQRRQLPPSRPVPKTSDTKPVLPNGLPVGASPGGRPLTPASHHRSPGAGLAPGDPPGSAVGKGAGKRSKAQKQKALDLACPSEINLATSNMQGLVIERNWANEGWCKGVIAHSKPTNNGQQHHIVYDLGTPKQSWELSVILWPGKAGTQWRIPQPMQWVQREWSLLPPPDTSKGKKKRKLSVTGSISTAKPAQKPRVETPIQPITPQKMAVKAEVVDSPPFAKSVLQGAVDEAQQSGSCNKLELMLSNIRAKRHSLYLELAQSSLNTQLEQVGADMLMSKLQQDLYVCQARQKEVELELQALTA